MLSAFNSLKRGLQDFVSLFLKREAVKIIYSLWILYFFFLFFFSFFLFFSVSRYKITFDYFLFLAWNTNTKEYIYWLSHWYISIRGSRGSSHSVAKFPLSMKFWFLISYKWFDHLIWSWCFFYWWCLMRRIQFNNISGWIFYFSTSTSFKKI